MGEYADDLIEGLGCSWCGVYFVEANGFPAACPACWKSAGFSLDYDRLDPPEEAIGVSLTCYEEI